MARDSARQAKEIELKLEFDPADAARLASHPALRAGPAPQEEHQLISTYFDTPDGALHKAGVYLRVRENDGQIVQTIKTAKSETDLIERLEWEREITSRNPDLDGVDDTPLKPLLTAGVRAALRPMFETQIRRHVFRILRDGSEIEVAIDQGEIATKTGMQAISELELELKRGKTKELFRLARVLGRTVPLRLEVKSKAERGYALLKGGSLQVAKAAEIDIPPNMSAEEAFRAIARSCVRQLVANEPILLAGRAEGLHQLRIGLRRLRAAIAIFADVVGDETEKKIKTELKWITQELGPARDLDVFAADVLEPLRVSHPSDAGLTLTQRNFEAKRKEAYRRATSAVRSDRFRAAVLDLVAWVETGDWGLAGGEHRKAGRARAVAEHAKAELSKLSKRIKRKGSDIRHLSVMQRHKLRIRAKRLRYATEFFAGTFPGEASARRRQQSLAALKDVQDALGGLNDLATRHALIADGLAVDAEQAERAAAQAGLAAPDTEETLLHKAEQAFARFAAIDPFWKA
jgi:inorganic triphosphatase YgiF